MQKQNIGKVTHYLDKIKVAVVELNSELKLGDKVSIEGHDSILDMTVCSMQSDKMPLENASAGTSIGLKVSKPVKASDNIYKII